MERSDIVELPREELEKRLRWFEKRSGPYIEKRGTENWRNLFRKPTVYEWLILFMILMGLFMGWAYMADTEQCRTTLENIEGICLGFCSGDHQETSQFNFTFTAGNNTFGGD